MIGDQRYAVQRRELCLPLLELGLKPREEGEAIGFVARRVCRVDARKAREDVGGDDLGVLGIEPIVRIAAAVGVAIAGPDAHAAHVERRDRERGVDVARLAAAGAGAGLREQPVEPQIEIEPDPHHDARLVHARKILRSWLILLGIEARRHEARHRDAVAADRLGKAAQIAGGGDDREPLLRQRRSGEREPRCNNGKRDCVRRSHLGACQMLFGIRQWTFFSVSETAPTRQSIATLASP